MALQSSPFWLWEAIRVSNSHLQFSHITYCKCVINTKSQLTLTFHTLFFPDDEFTNAEALILTFSLNNYVRNNSKFKVAMQWENEFLKIVQEYQKNSSTNFTFAYMAEVQYNLNSFLRGTMSCVPSNPYFFPSGLPFHI